MWKAMVFSATLIVFGPSAFAADPPSAGSQIQQIPPAPVIRKSTPAVPVEKSKVPALPATDQVKFRVISLHVFGQTLYSEAKLLGMTGFVPGGELTLSDLRAMALKIADYYHGNGYFTARAYLPQQVIKDATVTIAVVEGTYGDITLRNKTKIADKSAYRLLDGLQDRKSVV